MNKHETTKSRNENEKRNTQKKGLARKYESAKLKNAGTKYWCDYRQHIAHFFYLNIFSKRI